MKRTFLPNYLTDQRTLCLITDAPDIRVAGVDRLIADGFLTPECGITMEGRAARREIVRRRTARGLAPIPLTEKVDDDT